MRGGVTAGSKNYRTSDGKFVRLMHVINDVLHIGRFDKQLITLSPTSHSSPVSPLSCFKCEWVPCKASTDCPQALAIGKTPI